jgi:hypothetical protein
MTGSRQSHAVIGSSLRTAGKRLSLAALLSRGSRSAPAWLVVVESSGGLAPSVDELERFDDRLREDRRVIDPWSARNPESLAITVSFMVEAVAPDNALDLASAAFTTALASAGFRDGSIARLELEPVGELVHAAA